MSDIQTNLFCPKIEAQPLQELNTSLFMKHFPRGPSASSFSALSAHQQSARLRASPTAETNSAPLTASNSESLI